MPGPWPAKWSKSLEPFADGAAAAPASGAQPGGVLLASETGTHATVPTAVPVARNLDNPEPDSSPMGHAAPLGDDEPLIEPLPDSHLPDHHYNGQILVPDVQPLSEHGDGHGAHLEEFAHTTMGADKPRVRRPCAPASSKQKLLIALGLVMHLTATTICLGWVGCIPNPFSSKPVSNQQRVDDKKDQHKKGKSRSRRS